MEYKQNHIHLLSNYFTRSYQRMCTKAYVYVVIQGRVQSSWDVMCIRETICTTFKGITFTLKKSQKMGHTCLDRPDLVLSYQHFHYLYMLHLGLISIGSSFKVRPF